MQETWRWLARVLLGTGLGGSAILLGDYLGPSHALCGLDGGCGEVRNSAFSALLGIPTPVLGVLFFTLLAVLRASSVSRSWQLRIAAVGALGAASLLGIQAWVVGAFCRYCVVVDISAIGYWVVMMRGAHDSRQRSLQALAPVVVAASLYALVHLSLLSSEAPGLKAAGLTAAGFKVANETALTELSTADRLTITEFVDFQCPACRALHAELAKALLELGDSVRVVRRHVPLERHAHAKDAARAYCCAAEFGLANEMADALFTANSLSAKDCASMAKELGVPAATYQQCVDSGIADEIIVADRALASKLGVRALPTFFIGSKKFEGVRKSEELVVAVKLALANPIP